MKKLIVIVTATIYLLSCQSKKNETASTAVLQTTDTSKSATTNSTDATTNNQVTSTAIPTTNTVTTNQKTVDYYYQKYANVDSEDPQIGVGPRKIVSVDKAKGILTYTQQGNNATQTIQTWNKNGFDIVSFVGRTLLVTGEKEIEVNTHSEVLKLVKKVGDQRSARGGECTYSENPEINVKDKVEIILVCNDDAKFKDVIGYVAMQNGKIVVTEK